MAPSAARHHVTSAFAPFALHPTGQSGLAQTGFLFGYLFLYQNHILQWDELLTFRN